MNVACNTEEQFLPCEAGGKVLRPKLAGSWEFCLCAMDHVKVSYIAKPGLLPINSCRGHLLELYFLAAQHLNLFPSLGNFLLHEIQ